MSEVLARTQDSQNVVHSRVVRIQNEEVLMLWEIESEVAQRRLDLMD